MYLDGGLKLAIAQCSRAGKKAVNEDSVGIRVPEDGQLNTKGVVAVIADGVSAAEAGKEAAETCVTSFLGDYFSTPDSWTVKRSAQQILNALNRWLYSRGQHYHQAEKGYVSTLSVAVFKSHIAHLFHVGDSRIYRYRAGNFEQLTRDHARTIDDKRRYLTRAMGLDVHLDVDYRSVDIAVGDIFLLTTDGVHDFLNDKRLIELVIAEDESLDQRAQNVIDAALAADSDDNVSCQLLRVDALPLEDAEDVCRKLTELPFPPLLSPGMVVDGMRVEEEIHASIRSQLYRVYDLKAERHYVMKTPSENYSDDPAYIERFILESWIGKRISSKYVVPVVSGSQPPSCLYYLSVYLPGRTLGATMAARGKMSPQDTMELVGPIAKGLQAMHRRETFHQDLKPDNIIIGDDGRVTIVDFGSCYVAGLAEISVPIERDIVLGTAHYSSPEHVLGRRASARADQFSLAVITFEMLCGRQPYEGKLEHCQSINDYSRLNYVSACHYNPHVPIWLDCALKRALSVSPENRYHDIAEFVYDLEHPNSEYIAGQSLPFIQRNPLRFWQGLSLVLFLLLLWSVVR